MSSSRVVFGVLESKFLQELNVSISQGRHVAMAATLIAARLAEYRHLHAKPWPRIVALLKEARIADYRIYLHEPSMMLFATFRYGGVDLEQDIARLLEDPVAKEWHALTDACQVETSGGKRWADLEELFHLA